MRVFSCSEPLVIPFSSVPEGKIFLSSSGAHFKRKISPFKLRKEKRAGKSFIVTSPPGALESDWHDGRQEAFFCKLHLLLVEMLLRFRIHPRGKVPPHRVGCWRYKWRKSLILAETAEPRGRGRNPAELSFFFHFNSTTFSSEKLPLCSKQRRMCK